MGGFFDLIILALHGRPENAPAYNHQLSRPKPRLPFLLLVDSGVYVPPRILNPSIEAGDPAALSHEIVSLIAGSNDIRDLPLLV